MKTPDLIICDECGHGALVVFLPGHREGTPQLVAQLSYREDGTYATIVCPNCGKREQRIAPPNVRIEDSTREYN